MKYIQYLLLISLIVTINGTNKKHQANLYKTSYNLESEEALSKYLPERLRTLTNYVKHNGITAAIKWIKEDKDLDSYLFILDAQEPFKLLAYSRQEQFCNKTAQELQKILFGTEEKNAPSIALIFTKLISTAQKGYTYLPYQWRLDKTSPLQHQVAYVHLFTYQGKKYVLGAALFTKHVPGHFIITHRVQTIARRIKKEGLEDILPLLAHDPDPDMYFFVRQQHYPYRQIVSGSNEEFNLKSSEDIQHIVFPDCTQPELCNIEKHCRQLEEITQRGGGFYAYLWPKDKTELHLKIGYAQPIEYKKEHYILCSGFELFNIPPDLYKTLIARVDRMIALIKDIGLENSISVAHKENTPDAYVYIHELNEPYTLVLQFNRELEGKSVFDAHKEIKQRCHGNFCPNEIELVKQEIQLAKDGGGFYAYLWYSGDEKHKTYLKVSFLKPLTYNGKDYYIGSGYLLK